MKQVLIPEPVAISEAREHLKMTHDLEETMPTQQQDKSDREERKQERRQQKATIRNHVMHALGQPGNLQNVQVRQLWKDHYRVNVLIGADAATVRVAHSYFLVADQDGNIMATTPVIKRQY